MLCGGSSLTFGWHRHGLQDDLLAKAGTVLANSGVLKFGKGGVHVIGKVVFTRQRLGAGAPVTKLSAQHWTNATFSCRSLTNISLMFMAALGSLGKFAVTVGLGQFRAA
jgi:hypothetical protein